MMKPKIRKIRIQPVVEGGRQGLLLADPIGISQKQLIVPGPLALLLTLMDGTRDVGTLRTGFELRTGTPLSILNVEQLVSQLDDALFLENERFSEAFEAALKDYRSAASRPPALAGSMYPADPEELSNFLKQYFDKLANECLKGSAEAKGLICPHIDFGRGGDVYARVWSQAAGSAREAELVVILGTDHSDGEGRITLTRQNYETPWGIIPTAQDTVDELVNEMGESAFECELNHRNEHSIEAALIWIHYLLADRGCQVLPILCGSFQLFIERGESPMKATQIAATVDVLRRVSTRRRTLVVAAADLAHVGPVFGDALPVDIAGKTRMAKQDEELISMIIRGEADDFYAEISKEKDRRHVCGVPPIYIALSVLTGTNGTLVGYSQCPASNDGTSLVSICGMTL